MNKIIRKTTRFTAGLLLLSLILTNCMTAFAQQNTNREEYVETTEEPVESSVENEPADKEDNELPISPETEQSEPEDSDEEDLYKDEIETDEEETYIVEAPVDAVTSPEDLPDIEEITTSENIETAEEELRDDRYSGMEGSLRRNARAAATYTVAKAKTNRTFEVYATQYSSFAEAQKNMLSRINAASSAADKESFVVRYGDRVVSMAAGMAAATTNSTLTFKRPGGSAESYISTAMSNALYYYGTDDLDTVQVGIAGTKFSTGYSNLILIPAPFTTQYSSASNAYEIGYYSKNSAGELTHTIATFKDSVSSQHYESAETTNVSTIAIDKAPSFMATGTRYYSMDGVNFYKDQRLTSKVGTYYPYYQYLSYHTKTKYTAAQLNSFLDYYIKTYNSGATSAMKNSGSAFIDVQNKYGINALLEYAFACHESAYGTSNLAKNNNNLFGIKAYDSNPAGADSFSSISAGVLYHAETYLKQGYMSSTDYRYFGPHPGNKGTGVNVKYASDPFHGEKLASWAYRIDKYLGFKDYDVYQIGVTTSAIPAYSSGTSSTVLYNIYNTGEKTKGIPTVILGTSGSRYKIQSDMPIINGKADAKGAYSFSHVSYVNQSNVSIVRKGITEGWEKKNGNWYYVYSDGTYAKGWLKDGSTWYYLNSSGVMQTGWIKLSNKWYYLDGGGKMKTGWIKLSNKWYYLDGGGVMKTGWIKLSNKWYYLDGGGVMKTGWVKLSNKWYYLDGGGVMKTGWIKLSNKWYYLDGGGVMKTGWVKLSNKWYYLDGGGVMKTGWVKSSGKWYYMNSSGVMLANTSQKINGKTYRFNSSGVCQNP